MWGGSRIKGGPRLLQKMRNGDSSLLPLRSQGPGPKASLGHRARSPQPGGRGFALTGEGGRVGGRQPRPPPPQPSLAPPAPRAHRAPGPGRPAHPLPNLGGPAPLSPTYFLGVHGQGLGPLGPKPRRRIVRRGGQKSGTPTPSPCPPLSSTAVSASTSTSASACTGAARPGPAPPHPVRAQLARAPSSRRGCQGERAARRREGARSALRMRASAGRDGAEGVLCWMGGAETRERSPVSAVGPLREPFFPFPASFFLQHALSLQALEWTSGHPAAGPVGRAGEREL